MRSREEFRVGFGECEHEFIAKGRCFTLRSVAIKRVLRSSERLHASIRRPDNRDTSRISRQRTVTALRTRAASVVGIRGLPPPLWIFATTERETAWNSPSVTARCVLSREGTRWRPRGDRAVVTVSPAGDATSWRELDFDVSVRGLLERDAVA